MKTRNLAIQCEETRPVKLSASVLCFCVVATALLAALFVAGFGAVQAQNPANAEDGNPTPEHWNARALFAFEKPAAAFVTDNSVEFSYKVLNSAALDYFRGSEAGLRVMCRDKHNFLSGPKNLGVALDTPIFIPASRVGSIQLIVLVRETGYRYSDRKSVV